MGKDSISVLSTTSLSVVKLLLHVRI